jgi:hypothetical protein
MLDYIQSDQQRDLRQPAFYPLRLSLVPGAFLFQTLSVSTQGLLDELGIDTKVGARELLQNVGQADELSLGRPFQDTECTRDRQPTLHGDRASPSLVQQNLIGADFLSQANGLRFATTQGQGFINSRRRSNNNRRRTRLNPLPNGTWSSRILQFIEHGLRNDDLLAQPGQHVDGVALD